MTIKHTWGFGAPCMFTLHDSNTGNFFVYLQLYMIRDVVCAYYAPT